MRFDWFLPFRRKSRHGPVRRVLRRLGPSWLASPLRRLVQTACFLGFFWLFLYVAWPYTARPAPVLHGWQPLEVDGQAGRVVLAGRETPTPSILPGEVWHVVDAGAAENVDLGEFRVVEIGDDRLELASAGTISPEKQDRMLTSFGPWSLHQRDPAAWPSHYADDLRVKEKLPAELFLALDPLVSISTAVAGRARVWSLAFAAVLLGICLLVPRGFCAYVCPLGTTVDLFDWAVGRRLPWLRVVRRGWWVHLKYVLLAAVLGAALFGVLLSGFVAAIAVLSRAAAFLITPLQTAWERGWHQVPGWDTGQTVSVVLFAVVLGLGLLGPRFWCKHVCPSGALFSIANRLRLTNRKVTPSCTDCGRCRDACPFDAVRGDFTTRGTDCTFCQECGGVCPSGAIRFVPRWQNTGSKEPGSRPSGETAPGRRRFLAASIGCVAGCVGGAVTAAAVRAGGARLDDPDAALPVRPPGSVPEPQFLRLCVRCGECFQACPNGVLQPLGLLQGYEGLWTPYVAADHAGCEPSCNRCGQVCPTGAIHALLLEEKQVARMGLAVVDRKTCLPHAGREACKLCVEECVAAGYRAIEFVRVGTHVDELGNPVEGTGFLAPVVLAEKCVGCGLCQTRCYAVNARGRRLLGESAIVVRAGRGKEDRLAQGSYLELRRAEERRRRRQQQQRLDDTGGGAYLPDFLD